MQDEYVCRLYEADCTARDGHGPCLRLSVAELTLRTESREWRTESRECFATGLQPTLRQGAADFVRLSNVIKRSPAWPGILKPGSTLGI